MKRKMLIIVVLLIFVSVFIFQGQAFYEKKCTITVMDNENVILQKIYKIDSFVALKNKLFNKGDYEKLYTKLIEKEEFDPLSVLNQELSLDIKELPYKCNKECKNATVKYIKDGKFLYSKERRGEKIDLDKLTKDIFTALNTDGIVYLNKEYIQPSITQNELIEVTKKIAEFSTNYKSSSAERKHNIALACQKIENSKIDAGCQFSFNEVVGPRSIERGFQTAKIIIDGEFVEGVGGGVCQVSSTLYNAWCLAGLKVLRSATHSLPVSYIKPSLDAMVTSNSDLILNNNSNFPIYIDSKFDGENISFIIYGKPSGCTIKLRSEILDILPCEEYTEEKAEIIDWKEEELFRIIKPPKNGLVSASYREYYDDKGNLLYSERLRKTVYQGQKGKIVYKI